MLIILSQRIDTESIYSDKVFESYHYPARYKNQIHEGDVFIYYQGNRYVKEQRYYFGTGTVGKISSSDGENYYAQLLNIRRFVNTVPIYMPNGQYVEQLGYDTVRKSPIPPWQSSIRPLSKDAYNYIISGSGIETHKNTYDLDDLKNSLKSSIRSFYLDNNNQALFEIRETIDQIIDCLKLQTDNIKKTHPATGSSHCSNNLIQFFNYCETTSITYSYKLVLLMAFFTYATSSGTMKLNIGIDFFRKYYTQRLLDGKAPETKPCIYKRVKTISDNEIKRNLISNPIRALCESQYFQFDNNNEELVLSPDLWHEFDDSDKKRVIEICLLRLKKYYSEL